MPSTLHIQVLGGLHIAQGSDPVTGFLSRKSPALLVYLAVTQRSHSRNALAALLWGESSDADARSNLRQTLSNLRRHFEPYLHITREAVAFNTAAPYTLDSEIFEQHLHAAANATTLEHSAAALREAAALYQGDFLSGFLVRDAPAFEEWTVPLQARFRELALQALYSLTMLYSSRAAYPQAIDYATRLLALDSWREEAHRQLMLALMRSGQRSAALAQYEACRRILDRELGVAPSAETTALYERIRAARPYVSIPPANTPFVGRVAELAQVAQLLAEPTCRLITLIGPGGSGKTRLAREAAARSAAMFLHGACLVPLASVNSLDVVPSTIAETLGITLDAKTELYKQLENRLRDSDLLLVLDNLEHLPGVDDFVGRLAHACPDIRLLMTSRERLNLHGERLIELDGLDQPPSVSDEAIASYSSAQLFLASAKAVLPDFSPTAEDERAIACICQLVSGLPLAIELAAAWIRHLSCQEIADEIVRNLGFLATAQRNVPARHRSLLATFEHSWALLNDQERRTFARLAVFRGGCDRSAALAVAQCQPSLLAALCDKSLLQRNPSGRYTLHELLRQYGEGNLRSDQQEFAESQARHCRHYMGLLATYEDALSEARQSEARQIIATEIDNVRAAWEWAVDQQRVVLVRPALESMRIFFEIAGWYAEAVGRFGSAADAERAHTGDDSLLYGQLLVRQAWFYHRLDRFEMAQALIHQALPILRSAQPPLPTEEALSLQCLSNSARALGEFARAIAYSRQSLSLYRAAGNPSQIASALNTLGVALTEQGEFEEAGELHAECLAIRREIGDQRGVAVSLVNLGNAALGQGDYARAKPIEHEALVIFSTIGYPMGEAVALNNLGVAHHMLGEYADARPLLLECLALCRELGHRHIAAHALASLGGVDGALDNMREAWLHTREALQAAREISSLSATLFGLVSAAALLGRQGEHEQAAEIAALVFHHTAANRETQRRAEQLLDQLERLISAPSLAAAQERGQRRTVEDAVLVVLNWIG